jgi:transcriptional regulator with XRE-family HTH domain
MAKKTDKPFPKALDELLREHEMSQRELIRQTRKHGWGSSGHISFIMRDEIAPSDRAIETIAKALGVPPEHFVEYRLARARDQLDPSVVGFRTAVRNLERS